MSKYPCRDREYHAIHRFLTAALAANHGSILVVGNTGTGKSLIVNEVISCIRPFTIYIDALVYSLPKSFYIEFALKLTSTHHTSMFTALAKIRAWCSATKVPVVLVVDGIERVANNKRNCCYILSLPNVILVGMSNAMYDNIPPNIVAPHLDTQETIEFSYSAAQRTAIAQFYGAPRASEIGSACVDAFDIVRVIEHLKSDFSSDDIPTILRRMPLPSVASERIRCLPILQQRILVIFARLYRADHNVSFREILRKTQSELNLTPVTIVFHLSQLAAAGYIIRRENHSHVPLFGDYYDLNVDYMLLDFMFGVRKKVRHFCVKVEHRNEHVTCS
jgi:hypothetical protein